MKRKNKFQLKIKIKLLSFSFFFSFSFLNFFTRERLLLIFKLKTNKLALIFSIFCHLIPSRKYENLLQEIVQKYMVESTQFPLR
jgi:hypothetical protein